MSMTNTWPGSASEVGAADLAGTARVTGLLYLGLAITGVLGSMLLREQLYVADDPGGTLSNLVENSSMARLGIVLLMAGGVGYVLSTFVSYVFANADLAAGLLSVPSTIGELWIVGCLILFGVRDHGTTAEVPTGRGSDG